MDACFQAPRATPGYKPMETFCVYGLFGARNNTRQLINGNSVYTQ